MPSKGSKKLENVLDSDILDHQSGKLSFKDLAKKYNVSQVTLDIYFKENNILRRQVFVKETTRHDFFNVIDSEEKAYILGFYMSDGSITGTRFSIAINKDDLELVEKIRDILSPATTIYFSEERINKQGIKSNPICKLQFTSPNITETLQSLGFGKGKTYLNKSVKNIIPRDLMSHFIRGYFDGDGCISYSQPTKKHTLKSGEEKLYISNNYSFNITSKDPALLLEIEEYLKECVKVNKGKCRGCDVITVNRFDDIKMLYNILYTNSSICLNRKKLKFEEILGIPS